MFQAFPELCRNPGLTWGGRRSAGLRITEEVLSRVHVVCQGKEALADNSIIHISSGFKRFYQTILTGICFKLSEHTTAGAVTNATNLMLQMLSNNEQSTQI